MQLTTGFILKNTNKDVFEYVDSMCLIAKNLYNQMLHYAKEYNKVNGRFPPYYPAKTDPNREKTLSICLETVAKKLINLEGENNYYKLAELGSTAASQQLLKKLSTNINSFLSSISDWKNHPNKYKGMPRPPKYLKKNGRFQVELPNTKVKLDPKGEFLLLPKKHKIRIPRYVRKPIDFFNTGEQKCIDHVRIIPIDKDRYKIEMVYTYDETPLKQDNRRYLSIDLGIKNFATCITTDKELQPFILDGNCIKSYNKYTDLYIDKLKHKIEVVVGNDGKKRPKQYKTKRINSLNINKENHVNFILHCYSKYLVQYCIDHNICRIICGWNKDMKQKINVGHKNNRMIVNFPFKKLLDKLEYKCKMYGISFEIVEESYTSKTDHLRNAPLATKEDSKTRDEANFGKRIKRGLFSSDTGKLVNADVNGAMGIMRKAIPDFDWSGYKPFNPIILTMAEVKKSFELR